MTTPFTVHLDSDQRIKGSHSQFSYQIHLPPGDYDRIAVDSVSIPKTYYYLVDATFTLTEGGSSVVVSITDGNYTFAALSSNLQALLNTASPTSWTYVVSVPNSNTEPSTGKMTFTVSGNGGVQPTITTNGDSRLYTAMGFAINSVNTFVSETLVSTYVCILTINEIYVRSDLVEPRVNDEYSDCLISINVVNIPDFSSISYNSSGLELLSKPLNRSVGRSGVYNFTLTDNNDNVLHLFTQTGININLVFFRLDQTYDVLTKYIKYRLNMDKAAIQDE